MTGLTSEAVLPFGGEDRLFRLRLREIERLQSECGAGIGAVARRLIAGDAYIVDIAATLRLGLIGGGMSPVEAKRLVEAYVAGPDALPLAATEPGAPLVTAKKVMAAVWLGLPKREDADPGNGGAATTTG